MSDIGAILRLQRVAAALLAGEMPPANDIVETVAAIECFLARRCASLDAAFDLQPAVGERDIRNAMALADRNTAVAQGVALCGSAAAFAERLSRYRVTSWRSDRRRDVPPTDEIKAICWRALSARDSTLSRRRIEQIIREISSPFSFRTDSGKVSP